MSVRDRYNYNLYYAPALPIDSLDRFHRDPEKELLKFVKTITAHIAKFGLQNPPCVQRRKGVLEVRPGKCRVSAMRALGFDTIPALIVDYDQSVPMAGWDPLPHDRDIVQTIFSGDCIVEMSRRFCTVKKNVDVVHRPDVESAFAKELREAP